MAKGTTNVLQGAGASSLLQGGSGVKLQQNKPITLQSTAQPSQVTLKTATLAPKPAATPTAAAPGPSVASNAAASAAAASAAASTAADRAKIASLGGQSRGLIDSIKNIYNSIFNQADTVAADQNQQLTANYGKTVADTASEVAKNTDAATAAYTSRGLQDSSYLGNGQNDIKVAGQRAVEDAGSELKDAQGSIGQWLTEQRGNANAQITGLDQILSHIAESKDVSELTQLRAALEGRLTDAQTSAGSLQTGAQNRVTAANVTPAANRIATLQTTLGNIINSAAPSATKRSIATSFIVNSGLDEGSQNQLIQQLNGALAA